MLDIVAYVMQDHADQRTLLSRLASASDMAERRDLVRELHRALLAHGQAESCVLYPVLKIIIPTPAEERITNAQLAHAQIDRLLADLIATDPGNPKWNITLSTLAMLVEAHMQDEERNLLEEASIPLVHVSQESLIASMDQIKATIAPLEASWTGHLHR
jgi:hypothetical protein